MSEEKARAQSMRFQELDAIIDVLDAAYEAGIRTFMCTSHDRVADICDHFRAHPEKYSDYRFYPCMPYAHKYANAVTEHGMIEALRMLLPQEGAFAAMLKGGVALASKDIEAIMQLLIDAEMKMFHGLSTPVVFMQNVHHRPAARPAHERVLPHLPRPRRDRYGAEPGYITMNVPRLLDVARRARHRQSRSSAPTSTRSAFACAAASRRTRGDRDSDASGRSRCRCSRRGHRAARGDRLCLRAARIESIVFGRVGAGQHPPDDSLIRELSVAARLRPRSRRRSARPRAVGGHHHGRECRRPSPWRHVVEARPHGADQRVVADDDATEQLGAGTDVDVAADSRHPAVPRAESHLLKMRQFGPISTSLG
jgi:hypothetical protein